ncbi:MAG: hypothetical protein QM737_19395 [Ferruginibacter sp.]
MDNVKSKSSAKSLINVSKEKISFPTCRDLLIKGFEMAYDFCEKPKSGFCDFIVSALQHLNQIEHYVNSYNNETISKLVASNGSSNNELNETELKELVSRFKERWKSENQFFTIFDVSAVKEVYIDPRIKDVLGFDETDFKTASIEVLDKEFSIYEREELYNIMRFALIAYFLFTMPLFKLNPEKDYYVAKFRIRTHRSRNKQLKERKYAYAEKKCFFSYKYNAEGRMSSQYHFDLYTILAEPEHDYFYSNIISNPEQSIYMNMVSYLINLFLLDVSPKYLLLLDEKQHTDRYKEIADKVEKNIYKHAGLSLKTTEHQVADYFSKSIRKRIAQVFNQWDQRRNGNLIHIANDIEAVERAKQLGLLPIPANVKKLMYQHVR